MKIRFDDIPEEGLELDFSGEEDTLSQALESIPATKNVDIDARVRGRLQMLASGKDYFLLGTVYGTMRLQCSRCLTDFSVEKEIDVNMVIRQGTGKLSGREPDDSQDAVMYVEGPEVDPAEIILQELLLEIPMKPLCRDDCPGLCPRCGALKGSPECTCPQDVPGDSRWTVIERLKKGIAP